ncbi:Hypothetical_protein [Hexamita inflata]|uniref:Hypothetical_protein n=1 Tax=Hexamita inflata TaxID=28002 RepID=A0AA86NG50_9EUKA|nr:Hypothetical protein HINF_LOCUS6326 [Hexamita inflata]
MIQRRRIPVQIGLHEAAALRPWMLVPELLALYQVNCKQYKCYINAQFKRRPSDCVQVPTSKTKTLRQITLLLRRCAKRTQVYLKLMIIRVNLQFLYRRPNQYKRKLSE